MTTGPEEQPGGANGEAVDVAAVMRQVRRVVSERQGRQTDQELMQNLHLVNQQWDKIYEPLHLPPARSPLGKLWDVVRMRFHREVRGYLDPMMFRQSDFNASLVRTLNLLARRSSTITTSDEVEALRDEVIQLRERIRQLEERIGS